MGDCSELETIYKNIKINLLNDENARGIMFQALLLCAIGLGLYWLIDNTVTNLDNQGKSLV